MSNIKRNFAYSTILTTANYLFAFLTFPYISRVLGVTNLGICNFVDSVINYFTFFSLMGISIMGVRSIAAEKGNEKSLSETFSFLFWLNTISTAVVLVALVACTELVPKLHEHRHLMYLGAVKVLFTYLSVDWFYKGMENFRFITRCGLGVRMAYVASVFLFVRQPDDYTTYYFLSAMMLVLVGLINLGYSTRLVRLRLTFDVKRHMGYVKSFFILGLYCLLTTMYTTFNITYLGFACGETEVGYYTTATKLHTILLAIFTAFTGVMLPRMSSLVHEGDMGSFKSMLVKSFEFMLVFSLPLIVFAETLAPQIIMFISGRGYELAVTPMRLVMPLIFVIGYEQITVMQVLMPLKKDRAIFLGSCIGAAVGIAANILLVGKMGSIGSAIVWMLSEMAVLICSQYFTTRYTGFRFPLAATLRHLACAVPAAAVVYAASRIGGGNCFVQLLAGGVALVVYYAVVFTRVMKEPILSTVVERVKQKMGR